MAGRQRTFDLVPTTLVKSDGPKRAMTSKQAKKEYLKANKGPRVSKAEQRRQEAEELARQKYEWEKDKAAAKAKAVRDKKAAKAEAERQARRKAGIPEPSKHVRASQGRISHFVRAGNKRTWQEIEDVAEDSDATMGGEEVPVKSDRPLEEPLSKGAESEDEFGDFPSLSQTDILEKLDSSALSIQEEAVASNSTRGAQKPSDDEFGDFPSLSQSDFTDVRPETKGEPGESIPAKVQAPSLPNGQPSQQPPVIPLDDEDEFPIDDLDIFADMAATQLLSEAANTDKRIKTTITKPTVDQSPITPQPQNLPTLSRGITINNSQENRGSTKFVSLEGPVLLERSINMPPPPLPLKSKRVISFAPSPDKSRGFQNNTKPASKTLSSFPTSATQAFLENNLDDFFPSPSQEVRELADDFPSNTQITRELGLDKPVRAQRFEDLCSTQDLMSSQELAEICTPSRAPPRQDKQKASKGSASEMQQKNVSALTLTSHVHYNDRAANVPLPKPVEEKTVSAPVGRPRRRAPFFEEKEEDKISHQPATRAMEEKSTPANPAPAPRRGRFFEEKYEDVLFAVLEESKREEALRVASEAATRLPAAKPVPRTTRSSIQRVHSTATDYGDDDFPYSAQELAALP